MRIVCTYTTIVAAVKTRATFIGTEDLCHQRFFLEKTDVSLENELLLGALTRFQRAVPAIWEQEAVAQSLRSASVVWQPMQQQTAGFKMFAPKSFCASFSHTSGTFSSCSIQSVAFPLSYKSHI